MSQRTQLAEMFKFVIGQGHFLELQYDVHTWLKHTSILGTCLPVALINIVSEPLAKDR